MNECRHADDDPQAAADGGPEPDRRGDRHLPAHARVARRPRRLFRRPCRHHGGDRGSPQESRARQAALSAVRPLRRRPRAWRSRQLAQYRPAGRDRDPQPAAGLRRAHLARPHRVASHRGATRHHGGDAAQLAHRPRLPRDLDRGRLPAGVLHRADPGLRLLLPPRLGAGAARAARRVLQPATHGHRLLSDRQPDRRRRRSVPR